MRVRPLFACLLLLLTPFLLTTPAESADRALIRILPGAEATDPARHALLEELLGQGVEIVRDMDTFLLAVGSPSVLEEIPGLENRISVLDADTDGRTYYTVSSGARADLTGLASPVELTGRAAIDQEIELLSPQVEPEPGSNSTLRIALAGEHAAVVAATPEGAEALSGAGLEIARVFLRPIRLNAPSDLRGDLPLRVEFDPVVQEIVAAVDGSRIDATVQRLEDFVTRYATTDSCEAAAQYIAQQFQSFGIADVSFQTFSGQYAPNVVAVLPGVGTPEEIVLVGGHFDSTTSNNNIAPGADDNASGTSCVVECARVLSQYEFDRTIVFVAFSAEELGLIGSEAYAQEAAARGDDIVAMLGVDMIGYLAGGDTMDIDIISNSASAWMFSLLGELGLAYVPELPVVYGEIPYGASSDHASFWAAGYDAVLFFEDSGSYSPYIHTSNDRVGVSYNTPALAVGSVRLAASFLATVARPFRVSITHAPLGNTEESGTPLRIGATIRAAGVLDPDSLLVRYSNGGPFEEVTLLPGDGPDEFEAWIPAQAEGTFIDYYLLAADTEGNRAVHPEGAPGSFHHFFIGSTTVAFSDDFETDLGWTRGAPGDDATTGLWVRADPYGTYADSDPVQPEDDHTPSPGTRCWVTGNAGPGAGQGDDDVDGGKTSLVSPRIDLSGASAAWLRYHRWYTNDTGAGPGTDDWIVEASDDDGATWHRLETTSGSERAWTLVELELGSAIDLTGDVRLRFVAADEDPGSIVEAAIDDVEIAVFEDAPTWVEDGDAAGNATVQLAITRCSPNPFDGEIEIRFTVPADGDDIRLSVHDVTGRRVRELLRGGLPAGAGRVHWDGRDTGGHPVAAGIYFVRLSSDQDAERTERILRLR